MERLKSLNLVTELEIEGLEEPIKLDFSDKRFTNRLLHLVKKYENIEEDLQSRLSGIDDLENEVDKLIAFSDVEIEVLEEFRADVNNAFGMNLTDKLFGESCLPSIERYYSLFDSIMPYVKEAKTRESESMKEVMKKYGVSRLQSVKKE